MSAQIPVAYVSHLLERYRAFRDASRTRRLVSELPRHIQKDIGWPDTWAGKVHPRG